MAGLTLQMAGLKSRLGEESRDDGLDEREWGDMGLARGDAPWWSTDGVTVDGVTERDRGRERRRGGGRECERERLIYDKLKKESSHSFIITNLINLEIKHTSHNFY